MDKEEKNIEKNEQGNTEKKVSDQPKQVAEKQADQKSPQESKRFGSGPRGKRPPRGAGPSRQQGDAVSEFIEKVLAIKRVTKVTKGGKKLSFSALVVVGDGKGHVGFGHEKAGEVASAIKKSLNIAKKNMAPIHLKGTTIPHQIIGVNGAARVLLKPASDGTGVIASGAVRAVCEGAGIHNILTKCHRSNNPINVVKATLNGLTSLKTKKE